MDDFSKSRTKSSPKLLKSAIWTNFPDFDSTRFWTKLNKIFVDDFSRNRSESWLDFEKATFETFVDKITKNQSDAGSGNLPLRVYIPGLNLTTLTVRANVLLIENVRLSVDSSLFSRIFIKCGSLGGKQGTFIWRTRIRIDQILKLNFWILRSPAAETLDKNLTLILKFSKYKSTTVYKMLLYF